MIATQISTTGQAKKRLLDVLGKNLKQLDMRVARPEFPQLTFGQAKPSEEWLKYEEEVQFFEAIARSTFHLVYNEGGQLDQPQALQILYAIQKSRPIVLTHKPAFAPAVDAFAREVITSRIKQMKIQNLPGLELAELSFYLRRLPEEIPYDLSSHEDTLIRSRVKAHFRMLADAAKHHESTTRVFVI